MSNVIKIMRQSPDSLNSIPYCAAIAVNDEAAMRWIQDEVDGKHSSGQAYMKGKSAEYWVKEYPLFRLVSTELHE